MTYRLRLLGRFELSTADGNEIPLSGKKNQALLAILAVAGGEWVPRARLCDLLWQDRGETQARNSLRQSLAALRRAFAAHETFPVLVNDDAAAIDPNSIRPDTLRLNGAARHDALDDLDYAEFLDGLSINGQAIEHWLGTQRQRYAVAFGDALAARMSELEGAGDGQRALAAARRLLALDPLNENGHRAVIRLLARLGERSAALKHFEACRDLLKAELDVEPEAATVELYETLRAEGTGQTPAPDRKTDAAGAGNAPGIVVLPFENLSGDPAQDYFSNGLTDSITSELSRFHDLFVIASTSAFTYKNSDAPISQICRELAVRYVLEGSVQRAGDRVRINAKLVDGVSGRQLWAERYDRELDDLFAIQDDVTGSIVAALATTYGGRLRKAWQQQRRGLKTSDVKAFDLIARAIDSMDTFTDEGLARGKSCLLEAIELDPNCAKAHAKLGWTYVLDAIEGWKDDYEADMAQARQCALRALAADDGDNWAHWIMAGVDIYAMRHDVAIAGFEQALKLNPNDADVVLDFGYYLSLSGRAAEGLDFANRAMRLNPHYPDWYTVQLTQIYFDLRRYRDAIAAFGHVHASLTPSGYLYQAASHAALGEVELSQAAVAHALELDPRATLRKWTDLRMLPYRDGVDMEHLRANLIAAGLPA